MLYVLIKPFNKACIILMLIMFERFPAVMSIRSNDKRVEFKDTDFFLKMSPAFKITSLALQSLNQALRLLCGCLICSS